MRVAKKSIIKLEDNKSYLVDDIKVIDEREVALLQDLDEGNFIFAIEKLDEKGDANLIFVPDKEAQMELAKKFDEADGF